MGMGIDGSFDSPGVSSFKPSNDIAPAAPPAGDSFAADAAPAVNSSFAADNASFVEPGRTSQLALADSPRAAFGKGGEAPASVPDVAKASVSVPSPAKDDDAKAQIEAKGGTPVAHSHIDRYSDDVKQMQIRMQKAGIDPGPIDGLKGPLTRNAMKQYEAKFGKSSAEGLGVDPSWAELQASAKANKTGGEAPSRNGAPGAQPTADDRVQAAPGGMATFKGKKMTTGTAADLQQMSKAAERDGVALTINSAFRDPNYQAKLFKQAVAKYGSVAAARKWVAPPGRSQHQTGKAVDISMGKGSGRVHEWLRQNAAKFGFTQSYSWEPWHWFHRAS